MRVLVTGGAGYVGSRLVPALLDVGHEVVVYDTFFFGDFLPKEEGLVRYIADIRDIDSFKEAVAGCDAVIHLACLSNDPSSEIDADLTKEINLDACEPMVIAAKEAGVKRFINCSTSSVYGVSDSPNVTEDHELVPITLYNTYKAQCEPLVFKHQSPEFTCVTIRPSTVCGYSPRMRFDLAVNILTNLAVSERRITVFGGSQLRPNLHIDDMVRCYLMLLSAPAELIAGETFNVGVGNYSIDHLARQVRKVVMSEFPGDEIVISHEPTNDVRSYQVNSDKIKRVLGFEPQCTVERAVRDLCAAFRLGLFRHSLSDSRYFNVRHMKEYVFPTLYKDAPPSEFDPTRGHLSEIDVLRQKGKTNAA